MSTLPPVESPLVLRPEFVADPEVTQQLSGARRNALAARIVAGAGVLAAVGLVLLALAAWTDWYWEWQATVRCALTGAIGVVLAVGAWQGWRRGIAPYSLSRAAANVEHREPRLGQRLRTSLDYGDPAARPANASPRMVASLHADTRRLLSQTQWNDPRHLTLAAGSLALLAAVAMGWLVGLLSAGEFRIAAGRMFLLPWQYTEVAFKPLESIVKSGASVAIDVQVTGRPITEAKLRYRPAKGSPDAPWKELKLVTRSGKETSESDASSDAANGLETQATPTGKSDEADQEQDSPQLLLGPLVATLADLTEDVEFEVLAGPLPLPLGRVRVLQPLTLVEFSGESTPPQYTGLPSETISTPEFAVREGSQVVVRMKWNRPPCQVDVGNETPAVTIQGDLVELRWNDLRESKSFDMSAEASDGIHADPLRLRIRVQLDQKPKIGFVQPPEELEVTPTTEVALDISADDDLGLHKVGILCQVGSGPMQTLWEQDFAGTSDPVEASAALMLEDHPLSHQDGVTYYAFAEDNYFGAPRRVATPLRFIDIRPFQRSYQMLDNGGS